MRRHAHTAVLQLMAHAIMAMTTFVAWTSGLRGAPLAVVMTVTAGTAFTVAQMIGPENRDVRPGTTWLRLTVCSNMLFGFVVYFMVTTALG